MLIALLLPPLQQARFQTMRVRCAVNLQQLGLASDGAKSEYGYYPLWDDGAKGVRYTWIDVLLQGRYLGDYRVGYCPMDSMPDGFNFARGQAAGTDYPNRVNVRGVDYSYGIGVPLSAGGWKWVAGYGRSGDDLPRRFDGYERFPANRVLAADACWTYVYNLSGDGLKSGVWNDPAWYDNTVAWRHAGLSAHFLYQDGHVDRIQYQINSEMPVNTARTCVWYPGEPIGVGPDSQQPNGVNYYPDTPPPRFGSDPPGDVYPNALNPTYYTKLHGWTLILQK